MAAKKSTKTKTKNKARPVEAMAASDLSGSNPRTIKNFIYSGIVIILVAVSFFTYLIFRFSSPEDVTKYDLNRGEVEESNDQQGKLPQLFPVDFPIYENAQITNNWTTKSTNVTGMSVVWETNDKAVKVFNYYFSELASLGYLIEVISQTEENFTLSFEKENINGFIGVVSTGPKTILSVTVGIKNEY